MLSNDHKALTAKIEQLLQQLHADSRSQKLAGSSGPMEMDADPPAEATSHPEPPSSKRPHLDASSSSQDQMTGSAFTSAAAPFTSSVSSHHAAFVPLSYVAVARQGELVCVRMHVEMGEEGGQKLEGGGGGGFDWVPVV